MAIEVQMPNLGLSIPEGTIDGPNRKGIESSAGTSLL